jgi:antitoxin (DNA-binding transcriptional repressor) of toxin-antitoxin stability system
VATIAATIVLFWRIGMRRVGIREFRNQASAMISSGETLVIEHRGRPVGFFIPIASRDRAAGRAALGRLGALVDELGARTGLDEAELATEIGGTRRR